MASLSGGGKAVASEPCIIDTNVLSFLMDDRPLAEHYRPLLRGREAFLSFMTVGELYEGAYRQHWGEKRFRRMVRFMEHYTVIESSPDICQRWGDVRALRKRQPIAPDDAWIAATALVYGCPLVTHNPGDFAGIRGLQIVSAVPGR